MLDHVTSALVREGDIDAAPRVICGRQIARDDGRDHGPATAPLRPRFEPAPVAPVAPGEALGIGLVARAKNRQGAGWKGPQHVVFAADWPGRLGAEGGDGEQSDGREGKWE